MLNAVYRSLYPALPENLTLVSLVRFVLACVILLVPTTLMGMTLPIVVRSSLGRSASLGTSISLLYACNTAGGILGAYLAAFVLIGTIGVRGTTATAVLLNAAVGVHGHRARPAPASRPRAGRRGPPRRSPGGGGPAGLGDGHALAARRPSSSPG